MSSTQHAANGTCKHYWKIEEANGPTSHGICQKCGEVKEFKNSIDEKDWRHEADRTAQNTGTTRQKARQGTEDEEDGNE